MKKIILTGGGTAGHVIPNLALIPSLKDKGYEIHYIGSHTGPERDLAEAEGLPFYGISSGKLRRYFDLKNITDIFRVAKGLGDALKIIKKIKPDIVFSKGGFVVVPVIAAARLCGVRVIIHESDITPGLANRLVMPFSNKICVSFPETIEFLPQKMRKKAVLTGTPIRRNLSDGDRLYGIKSSGLSVGEKPILLVTGGSQGAAAINTCVREALPQLTQKFQIIHLCGRGNLSGIKDKNYAEFEYLSDTMPDALAAADIVLSRAGANTIFELLALKKPHLLIPLPKGKSRGDQIQNAESFEKQGLSLVLQEEKMTATSLYETLISLYNTRENYINTMAAHMQNDGITKIMQTVDVLV